MPDTSHAGFDYWNVDDLAFPFPIGQIVLDFSSPSGAGIHCDFAVPATLPHKNTVAERSIGITDSFKFWVALECTTGKAGVIECEAVLRVRHVTWFESHGETGPGPLIETRLAAAEVGGSGLRQTLDDHTAHCDSLTVTWLQTAKGRTYCHLTGFHWRETPAEFRAAQERARKEAEHEPPLRPRLEWPRPYDWDGPLPRPVDPGVDN